MEEKVIKEEVKETSKAPVSNDKKPRNNKNR